MKEINRNVRRLVYVILLTLFLLMLGIFSFWYENRQFKRSVEDRLKSACSFTITTEEGKRDLYIWYDSADEYCYLFVPGYLEPEDLTLSTASGVNLYFDDTELKDGQTLKGIECNKEYTLTSSALNKSLPIKVIQNGGVATLYLDLDSGSMDYLQENRKNEDSGEIALYTEDGKLDYSGKAETVKGHGNTSWDSTKKKPLNLQLKNKADLLGMGSSDKWLLLNNTGEATNLSNKLIYDFADEIGLKYSPDSDLVDVYANGNYYGMYLLSEKNEIAENRVDVETPTGDEDSSYLVSRELKSRMMNKGLDVLETKDDQHFRVVSPSNASKSFENQILSDLQSVENALLAEDGIDPDTGKSWDELIDLDSWVKKYLIEEIFENVDAVNISQYFYKTGEKSDDKLYAGPVWDYNSAFGAPHNINPIQNPRCLRANRKWLEYKKYHNWYYSLYKNEKFYNRLTEIYEEEVEPALEELRDEKMVDLHEKIRLSSEANFIRWYSHKEDKGYKSVDEDYESMHTFLSERIDFLNDIWINGTKYCYVTALARNSAQFRVYALKPGEVFDGSELPDMTGKTNNGKVFDTWYDSATGEAYDFSKPVTKDIFIKGHWVKAETEK